MLVTSFLNLHVRKKINNININEFLITENDIEEIRAVEHLKWAVKPRHFSCPSIFFEYDPTTAEIYSSTPYIICKLFDAAFSFIAFHEIWHIINKDKVPNRNEFKQVRPSEETNNNDEVKIKEMENRFIEAVFNENQSDSNALCSLIKLYHMKNRPSYEPLLGLSLALFYLATSEILSKPIISSNNYLQQNIPRLHQRGYIRLFNCLSSAISNEDDDDVNSPIYNFVAFLMRLLFPEDECQQTKEHSSAKAYLNELCEAIDRKYHLRD